MLVTGSGSLFFHDISCEDTVFYTKLYERPRQTEMTRTVLFLNSAKSIGIDCYLSWLLLSTFDYVAVSAYQTRRERRMNKASDCISWPRWLDDRNAVLRQETMLIDAYTDADLDLTASLVDGSNFRQYCCQGTWIYDNACTLPASWSA